MAAGRLASLSLPEGTIDYEYDDVGSLASISYLGRTVGYEYDWYGRLERTQAPEGQWVYNYNDAGLKQRVENLADGVVERREYDALGRLEKATHIDRSGEIVFEIDYDLGVDGRRLGATERRGANYVRWEYEYDPLGRLTRERRDATNNLLFTDPEDRDVSYDYDKIGNRTELIDNLVAARSRTYDYESGTQRLIAVKDTLNNGGSYLETYVYTPNGEVATKTVNGATETYEWGLDGTLAAVILADGRRVEYTYNRGRERVARRLLDAQGQVIDDVHYLVDRENPTGFSQVMAELDGPTGLVRTLNSFHDALAAQTHLGATQGMRQLVHADPMGSPRGLSDADTGLPTAGGDFDFTAFGSSLAGDPAVTSYAYTGQTFDAATGLQYHRARWYDPETARWMSLDRSFDFEGNFGHGYLYAGADPVDNVDYSGMDVIAVYRPLHDSMMPSRVAGHIYLAINDDNMDADYQGYIERLGFRQQPDGHFSSRIRLVNIPRDEMDFEEFITFSFHPRNVDGPEGNTDGVLLGFWGATILSDSWIVMKNDVVPDMLPLIPPFVERTGLALLFNIPNTRREVVTSNQQIQEAVLRNALADDNDEGNLLLNPNYSLFTWNCGSWAKSIVESNGAEWPEAAADWNMGIGIGGTADEIGLSTALYLSALAYYHSKEILDSLRGAGSTVVTVVRGALSITFIFAPGQIVRILGGSLSGAGEGIDDVLAGAFQDLSAMMRHGQPPMEGLGMGGVGAFGLGFM